MNWINAKKYCIPFYHLPMKWMASWFWYSLIICKQKSTKKRCWEKIKQMWFIYCYMPIQNFSSLPHAFYNDFNKDQATLHKTATKHVSCNLNTMYNTCNHCSNNIKYFSCLEFRCVLIFCLQPTLHIMESSHCSPVFPNLFRLAATYGREIQFTAPSCEPTAIFFKVW